MRLIDAELLEEQFGISDADILAKEEIRYAPTVDAVIVTRCKDCKHRIYKDMGEEIGEIGGCGLFNCAMPNEGFCSHGKRKDGGDG
jgi:hypothetical protein